MSRPVQVSAETLRGWRLPEPRSEKRLRGVVLVVAGSASTPGAARLAGEAALRAGAGKLKIATVSSVAPALAVTVPEAGVRGFDQTGAGDLVAAAADDIRRSSQDADATLLGSGWVDPDDAEAFLERLVPQAWSPLVLDALASAYAGRHADQLRALTQDCILTVNPSELAQTLGVQMSEVEADTCGAVTALVDRTGAVVVCGAEDKTIGVPDGRLFTVPPSGPGMAVSGSGDVQAGIVAGLLARGAEPEQAAVWGCWLHARAGDRLAVEVGPLGFLARELPGELPALLAGLGG